jgi:hypothetical protein
MMNLSTLYLLSLPGLSYLSPSLLHKKNNKLNSVSFHSPSYNYRATLRTPSSPPGCRLARPVPIFIRNISGGGDNNNPFPPDDKEPQPSVDKEKLTRIINLPPLQRAAVVSINATWAKYPMVSMASLIGCDMLLMYAGEGVSVRLGTRGGFRRPLLSSLCIISRLLLHLIYYLLSRFILHTQQGMAS